MAHGSGPTRHAGFRLGRSLAAAGVLVGCLALAQPANAAPPPHTSGPTKTGNGPSVNANAGANAQGRGPGHADPVGPAGGPSVTNAPDPTIPELGAAEGGGSQPAPGAVPGSWVDALEVDRGQDAAGDASPDAVASTSGSAPAAGAPTLGPNEPFGVDTPLAPFTQGPGGYRWSIVVALAAAAVSGFGLRHVTSRHEIKSARRFATRDPLTGLANRRLFEETLGREIARQGRKATPLALALIDLDGFKNVNDTRGHAAGDEALRSVAQAIVDRVRASDLAARIGGDEFAVVLPDCSPADALKVGEDLRVQIEAAVGPMVTASVGIAVVPDHAVDADALLAAADGALYTAKEHGRNRTLMATSPTLDRRSRTNPGGL